MNDEEDDYRIYMTICDKLAKNEMTQYEVSNFARKGFECVHNKSYWERVNYLGFGISAHSLVNEKRYSNISDISQYCSLIEADIMPINEYEILTEEQIYEEKILLGLRSNGVILDIFDVQRKKIINDIISKGFGEIKNNKFVLNAKDKFICDEITLKLLC